MSSSSLTIPSQGIVDCDVNPVIPKGWTVKTHIKGGKLKWDPKKVALYLTPEQRSGRNIYGFDLYEQLKGQPVLNANILDFLLANPELRPGDWKGKAVFFWGTIYYSGVAVYYVRCLTGDGRGSYLRTDYGFGDYPAAILLKLVILG